MREEAWDSLALPTTEVAVFSLTKEAILGEVSHSVCPPYTHPGFSDGAVLEVSGGRAQKSLLTF